MEPLWFAGRVNFDGADSADVLNFLHPKSPRAWIVELLIFDSALSGSPISITAGTNLQMAQGGIQLDATTGATGFARIVFGLQGGAGSIRAAAPLAPATARWEVNCLVTEVSTMPTGNNVTAW